MVERGSRELPVYVWIALAGCVVFEVVQATLASAGTSIAMFEATVASEIAASVVVAIAALDLRRGSHGLSALGSALAGWTMATAVCLEAAQAIWLDGVGHIDGVQTIAYASWSLRVVAVVGLVVTARRSIALAILGGVLALADQLPPCARESLSASEAGPPLFAFGMISALGWTGLLLLLVGAARGPRTADRGLAREGLMLAARSVWLRVYTICAATVIAMSLGGGVILLLPYAVFGSMVIGMVASMLFGIGLLRAADSALTDLPRGLLGVAGVLALWCGGVTVVQLPWAHDVFFERRDLGELVSALAVVQPIVAALSVALVATALTRFAHARGDGVLAAKARTTGVAFVMLAVAALFVDQLASDGHDRDLALLPLVATALGLIAQIGLGQLCAAAARSIDASPALPTATLVK